MSGQTPVNKPRRRSLSLNARITGVAMVTAVTVLLVACMAFVLQQWAAEREDAVHHQRELAQTMARQLAGPMAAGDRAEVATTLAALTAVPTLRSGELRDASGVVLLRYAGRAAPIGSTPTGSTPTGSARTRSARTGSVPGAPITGSIPAMSAMLGAAGARPIETTTDVVTRQGRRLGALTLRSNAPTLTSIVPRYLSVSMELLFFATAVSLVLGRPLALRVLEPVQRLSVAMQAVSAGGDFDRTVERIGDDELARLTDTFNGLLGMLDVNDKALRRTLSDLTVARDAAETANILKSQFLANMSHEIRTPLNGVLAMAQIMALSGMDPVQAERLEVIRHSGETLLAILNDILDISKIEAGKLELEDAEFDFRELVGSSHAQFKGMAEHKRLDYRLTVAPTAPGVRRGDAARLRQILNNLISNAVKFTAAGAVDVLVEGEGEGGADGVRVTVRDSGIGVSPAKLPLLFQKFTQVDSSTTRRFGGTGLGLAICHELAQLMGGRVWAESVEGVGSTFGVSLPFPRVAEEGGASASAPAAIEDQGRLLRVLAAEDNPTNQLVLTTILQIFGAELTLVGDGAAAVEAWRTAEFDVVLMDIQMPVLDGVGATRAIRGIEAAERRTRTPIIALSANAMVHQIRDYLAAGMDGHVAKPIELPKLHAALETALAMSEAAREAA